MSPLTIGLTFLRIGSLAFGGLGATLVLIEREMVQHRGALSSTQITEALTYTKLLPGSTVGFQVAGLGGALASTIGAFVAPWALAGLAAQQVTRFAQNRRLRAFGSGAAPAVVGVLGLTLVSLGREAFDSWPGVLIGAVAYVLARWTRMRPFLVVILGGAAGYVLAR